MRKKRYKKSNQDKHLRSIILATAIISLIEEIIKLLQLVIKWIEGK